MDAIEEAEKYTSKEGFTAMDAVSAKYIIENLLKKIEAKEFTIAAYIQSESGLIHRIIEAERKLAEAEKVIELANKAFKYGAPDSFRGDDDEVGECAFCQGWNQHHKDNCEANALMKALSDYEASKGE